MCTSADIKLLRNPDGDVGPMYQTRFFICIIVKNVGNLDFRPICLILILFSNQTKENRLVHSIISSLLFFFLPLNLLICWQLSIWICCRPFSSLLYNYQLLCFWRLALSIVVEVVPRPFSWILLLQECLLQTRYV